MDYPKCPRCGQEQYVACGCDPHELLEVMVDPRERDAAVAAAYETAAKDANDPRHWAECPKWIQSGIDAYRQRVISSIRALATDEQSNALAERDRRMKAEGLRETAKNAKERRDYYTKLVGDAERRGPSYPGYVTDFTYHHWGGKASAYSEIFTDISARAADLEKGEA